MTGLWQGSLCCFWEGSRVTSILCWSRFLVEDSRSSIWEVQETSVRKWGSGRQPAEGGLSSLLPVWATPV